MLWISTSSNSFAIYCYRSMSSLPYIWENSLVFMISFLRSGSIGSVCSGYGILSAAVTTSFNDLVVILII